MRLGSSSRPHDDAESDPVGIRGPHELLHIVLRQLDNPALGGGKRKGLACKDIANRHHQLTGALGLAEPNQSSLLTEDDKACGMTP